ncbi:MAG: Cell division protein FtsL [Wolbachia endosymbiont of Ctenocephalides orientis wCori]|nr:MAG: Cell division protein FtsL [Wolbachia endosymbiont of Ctenocephalides orientis wCori]
MKIFLMISIITFFLSVIVLFQVKLHTQSLNRELIKIKNEINLARNDMQVLQAEWSYLNNPKRLAKLAERYLKNNSLILTNQIKNLDSINN